MIGSNFPIRASALLLIGGGVFDLIRRKKKPTGTVQVRAIIVDYFRRSGVEVSADCVQTEDGRYIALVESEPMKRFRLSHIIEMTLREVVRKSCGLELDKIYWRFPIKEVEQGAGPATAGAAPVPAAVTAAAQATETGQPQSAPEAADDYINEGLEHYRHIPKPEVTEVPWESFEQAATGIHKTDDKTAG